MSKAYDPELIHIAQKLARELEIEHETHTGVYTCLGGPNYETVAELRMWKLLGVDAVGMSTVHEVITAVHCDMKVFAFSLITNKCETEYETHEEGNFKIILVHLQVFTKVYFSKSRRSYVNWIKASRSYVEVCHANGSKDSGLVVDS
jgi:purine nucleoside phosphorylase